MSKKPVILSHTKMVESNGKYIYILADGAIDDEDMNIYLVNQDILSYNFRRSTKDPESGTYIYVYAY